MCIKCALYAHELYILYYFAVCVFPCRVVAPAAPIFLCEQVQSAFDGVDRRHVPVERQKAHQRLAVRSSDPQLAILLAVATRQCYSHFG